jgi:hypothetical protein
MSDSRDMHVNLLAIKTLRRGPREFRKTRSTWGDVETNFGPIGYESSLEQCFLFMMIADPQTTNIDHQPFQINFTVANIPRIRRYTPDYLIERDTKKPWVWGHPKNDFGNSLLAEIKPHAQLSASNRSANERHSSGQQWAVNNGATYRVITERFIEPIAVNNSLNVISAGEAMFPKWVRRKPVISEPMLIADIFKACTVEVDDEMVPHFLYLGLARGWFWCPLNIRLSLTTIVYPP